MYCVSVGENVGLPFNILDLIAFAAISKLSGGKRDRKPGSFSIQIKKLVYRMISDRTETYNEESTSRSTVKVTRTYRLRKTRSDIIACKKCGLAKWHAREVID